MITGVAASLASIAVAATAVASALPALPAFPGEETADVLVASAFSPGAQDGVDALVSSALPIASQEQMIDALIAGALPPPPVKANIQTTYGTVTLDHVNHLHARVSCRLCHGPRPVGPVHLGPEVAHQTCKGCHRTEQRGPVACTGCHARPTRVARKDDEAAEKARAERAAEVPAVAVAVAPVSSEIEEVEPYKRVTIEGGFTGLQGTTQHAVVGPFLQLRTRRGSLVFTQSVELPGGLRNGRTLGLLGGGSAFAVAPRWNVVALGLLGFDIDNAQLAMFPMCGVRAGVEWMQRAPTLNVLGVSITAARDFGGRRHQAVEMGTVWSLTFTAGNEVGVARRP